jgi:hypothetical protein
MTSPWPFRRHTQTTGCIPSDGCTGLWTYNSTVIKRYSCQPYSLPNNSQKVLRHLEWLGEKKAIRTICYKDNPVAKLRLPL